jgi:SPX domain protein involved in polyphosphate accumulation
LIYQKRVLSIVSGAILPIVALGFIKSLVDYIRPSEELTKSEIEEKIEDIIEEKIEDALDEKIEDVIEEKIDDKVEELEEKVEELEEKVEAVVDGGDSNEPEIIPQSPTEPLVEPILPLNAERYHASVDIDPMKIN